MRRRKRKNEAREEALGCLGGGGDELLLFEYESCYWGKRRTFLNYITVIIKTKLTVKVHLFSKMFAA
jgi:hypothetical protein